MFVSEPRCEPFVDGAGIVAAACGSLHDSL